MARPPAKIRINPSVPFPAQVSGVGPVTIGKQNGIWQFGLAPSGVVAPGPYGLVTVDQYGRVVSGSAGRQLLTATTTYYVRTTGNDSNNGLTPATAFLTVEAAVNFIISHIDPFALESIATGQFITIDIGAGTFTSGGDGFYAKLSGNPIARFLIFSGAGATTILPEGLSIGSSVSLAVQNLSTGLYADTGAFIFAGPGINFNSFGSSAIYLDIRGSCYLFGANTWDASDNAPQRFARVLNNSYLQCDSGNLNLASLSKAISIAFVEASNGGVVNWTSLSILNAGSITGKRYNGFTNAVISNGGSGGANFFPGNVAGTVTTGAQYFA